jgi:hypothetical protein
MNPRGTVLLDASSFLFVSTSHHPLYSAYQVTNQHGAVTELYQDQASQVTTKTVLLPFSFVNLDSFASGFGFYTLLETKVLVAGSLGSYSCSSQHC